MPKINARKCPKTGKLFETDKAYRIHIIGLRKNLNKKRPHKIRMRECMQRRKRLRTQMRDELDAIRDINELECYVKNNFGRIMTAYNGGGEPIIHAMLKDLKMEEFELRINFHECVSNSHASPRNGKTNWGGRDPDLPRGYPGFSGHVSYALNFDPEKSPKRGNLCLDAHRGLGWAGIHTGGGGGRGNNKFEYGVNIYLSDFDGLQKLYFKDKLAGEITM